MSNPLPNPVASQTVPRTRSRATLLCLLFSFVYLYLVFFVPSFVPIYLGGDGAIYLADAERMLAGQVLYRDFFQFIPPGTDLLFFALFKLFGLRLWIPNLVLLLTGLTFAWLSLVISRRVLSPRLALLPGALFLVFAFTTRLDATHHWFSALAVVASLAVLIEKRSPARIAWAGFLCGVAACFTQTRGLASLLAIGVFLIWERRRSEPGRSFAGTGVALAGSFLAPVLLVNGAYVWKAGLHRFLSDTVVFVARYYPADKTWNSFRVVLTDLPLVPPLRHLPMFMVWLFLYGLIPFIYILFFIRYRRRAGHPAQPWDRLMLIAVLGIAQLLAVASAPGWIRMAAGSLPALILLGWLLDSPARLDRTLTRLVWAGTLAAALVGVAVRQLHERVILNAPGGRTAILYKEISDKYQWVAGQTRPGDYFFEAAYADAYFLIDLRNPTPLPFVSNTAYTRPDQVKQVIGGLEDHRVRYVLWSPDDLDVYPPGIPPEGDNLGPLRDYLKSRYHVVKTFDSGEQVWERNP